MCGIAGIWDRNHPIGDGVLERMRESIAHRGPDDRGLYVDATGSVGLAHLRLAILDPSPAGHQPMERDGLYAVHNGEIYNFRDVRRELASKGHEFTTATDTEVILVGYREWGLDVFRRFRGMFVTALWDDGARRLTIIRDRAGVKPLYYFDDPSRFVFGSELRAVVAHPDVPREVDFDALGLYLKLGYVPAPLSILRGVSKLPPGSYLTLQEDGQLRIGEYWNVFDCFGATAGGLAIGEEEATRQLEAILLESFELRMVSDVPVGVFLSGGIDSTIVAALLQSRASRPIQTFTIGFHAEGYNEADAAKGVALHLGTDHHEMYCTPQDALDIIPQLADIYDEPFGDASGIPTYLVARFARDKVKVALSADGGDEVSGGYPHHHSLRRLYEQYKRMGTLGRSAVSLLARSPIKQLVGMKIDNIDLKLRKLEELSRKGGSMAEFLFVGRSIWPEEEAEQLLGRRATGFGQFMAPFREAEEIIPEFVNLMRAADYRSYLADDILVKVDRATMAVGLEGRDPFLDQHVIEFCAGIPLDLLNKNGRSKHLLKKILYRYVPEKLVDRPKQGFAVPLDLWLRDELKPLLVESLSEATIRRDGIFNWPVVNDELQRFLEGRRTSCTRVWLLLEFMLWKERWLDRAV